MAVVATLRNVGAVHPINIVIDIIINDSDNNFNKQTKHQYQYQLCTHIIYRRFYTTSQSFSPVDVCFSLFFRSVWILASVRTPVDAVSHLLSPSLPPALVVAVAFVVSILVLALAPAHRTGTRGHTHVRTPSTNSHPPPPNPQSNDTTVFLSLPPARYSLILYVLPLDEQSMEKQQMLKFHVVYD
jgi:hypothetical protein